MTEVIPRALRVEVMPAYDDRRVIRSIRIRDRRYEIGHDGITRIVATREAGESGWIPAFEIHYENGTARKICARDWEVEYSTIEQPKSDPPF